MQRSVVFAAAPGLEEMQHVYNNLRVSNAMSVANTNLSTFETIVLERIFLTSV